jgi:hypothetical protein
MIDYCTLGKEKKTQPHIYQKEGSHIYLNVYAIFSHLWKVFKKAKTKHILGTHTYMAKLERKKERDNEHKIWSSSFFWR